MGTRINFQGTRNNSRGVDKKIYRQTKNLRAAQAAKMFGHLYNVSGHTK